MSDTYIGPFGRLLPVREGSDSPESPRTPTSNMIAHQAPYLPLPTGLPTGLDFGSDPRPGFTDPNRYGANSRSRGAFPPARAHIGGTLPPVRQLLSPVTPPGADATSFSPRFSTGSPTDTGSIHLSPRPNDFGSSSSSYHRLGSGAFSGSHPQGPQPQLQYSTTTRELTPAIMPNMQCPLPTRSRSDSNNSNRMYPSNLEPSRQVWQTSPPTPLTATHYWPPSQRSEYRPSPTSGSNNNNHPYREVSSTSIPLPKMVREEIIPGDGPCYIYDDGTRVKKFIDGEVVNAQWGITKAGKPRKRLAIACTTCREKKIKCEPTEAKCTQCDKSGRECRFQSTVRGQYTSFESHSYEQQARASSSSLNEGLGFQSNSFQSLVSEVRSLQPSLSTGQSSSSLTSATNKRRLSPESDALLSIAPAKRHRRRPLGQYEIQRRRLEDSSPTGKPRTTVETSALISQSALDDTKKDLPRQQHISDVGTQSDSTP